MRLPRPFMDYVENGSYQEQTLAKNRRDLDSVFLRQRVLRDVSTLNLGTRVLGEALSLPIALAPTGLAGLLHSDGERGAARAAQEFGSQFCLSTFSIHSIEEVVAPLKGRGIWFQLFIMRDRGITRSLIERAHAANCTALFVTVDTAYPAQRHRDVRNGLTVPPRLSPLMLASMAARPGWCMDRLRGARHTFGNLSEQGKGFKQLAEWSRRQGDPSLTWSDIEWVRSHWKGKLAIKGIMDPDDAERAVELGADAVVVSNHGGRQQDGTASSISVLPSIARRVSRKADVIFDGGILSGHDVLKAVALGAKACFIGRAYLYGLAAYGESGVRMAISILRRELEISMALSGITNIQTIDERSIYECTAPTVPNVCPINGSLPAFAEGI